MITPYIWNNSFHTACKSTSVPLFYCTRTLFTLLHCTCNAVWESYNVLLCFRIIEILFLIKDKESCQEWSVKSKLYGLLLISRLCICIFFKNLYLVKLVKGTQPTLVVLCIRAGQVYFSFLGSAGDAGRRSRPPHRMPPHLNPSARERSLTAELISLPKRVSSVF